MLGLMFIAMLTAIIETAGFFFLGYRKFHDCLCFFVINLMSNLLLNETLTEILSYLYFWEMVIGAECVVVLLEFALCCCMMHHNSIRRLRKLFMTVLTTNMSTFLGSVAFMRIIKFSL